VDANALRAFNILAHAGLIPVPAPPRQSGAPTFYCHTLKNTAPASAALASYDPEFGRWGVLAPGPLQSRLLRELNGR
jgi:hypothetical protein